jgi:hypothetical protein
VKNNNNRGRQDSCSGTEWPSHQLESIMSSCPDAVLAALNLSHSGISVMSRTPAQSLGLQCTSEKRLSLEIPESPTCTAEQNPESLSHTVRIEEAPAPDL